MEMILRSNDDIKIGELADDKLFNRQKALVFLADLLHSPENVSQALGEGN
jgi:hypothetical protein